MIEGSGKLIALEKKIENGGSVDLEMEPLDIQIPFTFIQQSQFRTFHNRDSHS